MSNGEKMWRIFEGKFMGKKLNILSSRKMTDDERDEVYKRTRFRADLKDIGVDYAFDTCIIYGCYSTNGTREDAEEFKKRLDNGEKGLDILLGDEKKMGDGFMTEDIVTRLRAHPSRDNRALLDEAADKIEHLRDIAKMMDNELANHKHAEDAYITIIDRLKRRIEHECVAWHPASEWPERDEWVIAAIDGAAKGKIYDKCIAQVEIDHYNKRLYDEDIDVTELVRYWCYEPEWPEELEEEPND